MVFDTSSWKSIFKTYQKAFLQLQNNSQHNGFFFLVWQAWLKIFPGGWRRPCCALSMPGSWHSVLPGRTPPAERVMTTLKQSQCVTPEGCLGPAAFIRSKDYCYSAQTHSTVLQGLPFGGVPTVLVLNFMCFLVSRPLDQLPLSLRHSDSKRCFVPAGAALFVLLP